MNTFLILKKYVINEKVLDKYQTKAVLCDKNAYLVVAGAGSGKTLTITAKVKYLLDLGYDPKEILCISFTNETVNSLRKSLNDNNILVDVKTFHKLSLDIVEKKQRISNNYLLKYIIEEYFYSFIYHDKTYLLLEYINNINNIKIIIETFINQMKTNNYNEIFLINLLKNKYIDNDNKIILIFILKIYLIYQEELKSTNSIDFNDIINLSIENVDKLKYFKYKYLIIDEYQDTSLSKYKLLKKLYDKFKIKIMAVGDDYQSIYSFTGCNIKLFINFKRLFPKSKIIKLKYTYRNPKDIVEISKRMVIINKNQINKKLISNKYINNSIEIVYYDDEKKAINHVLRKENNILVLGRNNKDIENLINNKIIAKENNIYYYLEEKEKKINCLTVHSSKGLEEDIVIVLNMIDDTLGFPNKIKESEILAYVKSNVQVEEERRLFYVALTRARKKVYLFTIKNKESIYIKELIKRFKYKIKITDLTRKNF